MARVVVVGSINHDVTVRVGRRPRPGETVVGAGPVWSGGGKGANAAVAAAGAGAEVLMCGAVGDDGGGHEQLAGLRRAGVDVSGVAMRGEVATGVALIVVTPDGENSIVVGIGANHTVDAAAVRSVAPGAQLMLAQSEIGAAAVDHAAAVARDAGCRLVLSLAPVVTLDDATMQGADPLVLNQQEALELLDLLTATPTDDPADLADLADALRRQAGCRSVVVTLGATGAVVADASGSHRVPAPQVTVVDTTGAGDVLTGVLTAALADGDDLAAATERACAAAARSVGHAGARSDV